MAKSDIEMNMLRERAMPLPSVTEEMFLSCNQHNVELVKEYLETSNTLSKETLKQYKSGMYQFTYYLKENLMDKPFYNVTKRDFKRYMSYLVSRGMSSSALKFKKSAVSAFCSKFIEIFIVEDVKEYATFRNFTTGTIDLPKNQVYNKIPITKEEYDLLIETLLGDKNYLAMCWVAVMWNCGCRRSESIQFKSEIVGYDRKDKPYVLSHLVRGKGKSEDGKPIKYMIPNEALKYIELWLSNRGYEHEYIFTVKHNGEICKMGKGWANELCTNVLSDIVGRRINVHLFKSSCVTYMLEQGKSMKTVSKYIAHHESTETTSLYDLRNDDEEREGLFD
ncbi:MAG: site-specific integrase [Clostridia bacterium]